MVIIWNHWKTWRITASDKYCGIWRTLHIPCLWESESGNHHSTI